MDPVIFTGRVPIEEFKHDKPDEYDELVPDRQARRAPGRPDPTSRSSAAFRIFGFAALAIGLTLIALIVYAMLFAYQ